jgi:transposase-like protein
MVKSKLISDYVHGITTREIQGHLEETSGAGFSYIPICIVTDAIEDQQ